MFLAAIDQDSGNDDMAIAIGLRFIGAEPDIHLEGKSRGLGMERPGFVNSMIGGNGELLEIASASMRDALGEPGGEIGFGCGVGAGGNGCAERFVTSLEKKT